jgi:hypothetical protein
MEQMITTLSAEVAHHLQFEFLPTEKSIPRSVLHGIGEAANPRAHDLFKLFRIECRAAAGATERELRADDRRITVSLRWLRLPPTTSQSRRAASQAGFVHRLLEEHAFSATLIASRLAPIISTPCSSSTPASSNAIARFKRVCPPTVGSSASGFSFG